MFLDFYRVDTKYFVDRGKFLTRKDGAYSESGVLEDCLVSRLSSHFVTIVLKWGLVIARYKAVDMPRLSR